jgi:hypothetical protein
MTKLKIFAIALLILAGLLPGCANMGAGTGTGADATTAATVQKTSDGKADGNPPETAVDAGETAAPEESGAGENEGTGVAADSPTNIAADSASGGRAYRLKEPDFIELDNFSFCKIAEDYISLTEDAFSQKYSPEDLWKNGAFDRLLFTGNAKGKIIAGIGIGSSLKDVTDTFGEGLFGTKEIIRQNDISYKKYLLYGYKARSCYFAFQIDPKTELVQSICFRKRYEVPDNLKDMLVVLAKYEDWYGSSYFEEKKAEWNHYFDNERIKLTQWGRGSMTMICDYGFTSSSGTGLSYEVYRDFSGDVPVLPERQDEFGQGSYDPVRVMDMDYPEWMIYRIYNYLAEQASALEQGNGKTSPDGSVYAYAANEGDWLDLQRASGLYETAHVVFHWRNASNPDRQVYFGHYSTVVGFIGNRYFVESDMLGLHVLDLRNWKIVYMEEDMVDGRSDLRIDESKGGIFAEDGSLQYSYKLDKDGNISVRKVAE